jgi:hypothetical protein
VNNISEILIKIKNSVQSTDPDATVILLNKRKVNRIDERRVKYPLYDIEFDTGQIISPIVLSKSDWETRHRITPFYHNISKEGITL